MIMEKILVTGGAGYIGSHLCKYLAKKGYLPVVVDNLVNGHKKAVKWGPFYQGSIQNPSLLDHVFTVHRISCVMHFAAYCYVGESVSDPGPYYENNVANTISLLSGMRKHGIDKLVFSSSCTTYGTLNEVPVTENHPKNPINPYGRSKRMVECILKDYHQAYGISSVCLRYFNAAGADPEGEIGEDHDPEPHLIPLVLYTAMGKRKQVVVNGNDYPTKDGTCIRDFIHIEDLALAHHLALERLLEGKPGDVYNLGNAKGFSIVQIIETAEKITGKTIPRIFSERRPGDAPVLVGSSEKAVRELGYRPQHADLETIIRSAWNWHRSHPDGYADK